MENIFLCALGIIQHSDHHCSLCSVDMNDACLCLGLMWSLLSTSSWGHCSVCLSASLWRFLTYSGDTLLSDGALSLTLRKIKESPQRPLHSAFKPRRLKTVTFVVLVIIFCLILIHVLFVFNVLQLTRMNKA